MEQQDLGTTVERGTPQRRLNKVYNELDHRLSVVKRWSVLHTIQQQSVAEHCFNVQRIAVRIAVQWLKIAEPDKLLQIMQWAHHHDDFEALSGDFPSMIKPYFDEEAAAADHQDLIPSYNFPDPIRKIVKLADKLEGYHFLSMEAKLGNHYAREHQREEVQIVIEYIRMHWSGTVAQMLVKNASEFMSDCDVAVSTRFSRRGR